MHAHGLNIPKVSIASGLSEGTLSRLFKGERGGTTKTVLAVAEAAPTVPPLELLRALAQTRAEWLRHEKVRRLIATR
jgi:AraC-like DNA-binding protein